MVDLNSVLDANKRVSIGNMFAVSKDLDTAIAMFESARDADPGNMEALCNGALILKQKKDLWRAEQWVKQALRVNPEHPHALSTYALIAQECVGNFGGTNYHQASVLFEHSLRNDPNNVTTLLNYAYMLQLVGDYPKALEIYTRARDLNMGDINTRFQRSMCLLTIASTPEQWREALDEYEIRQLLYRITDPKRKPIWTGKESLHGRTILIVSEQGIGDTVMMARYAKTLKELHGCELVYLFCKAGWEDLMDRVPDLNGVYSSPGSVPDYDYYIPAMSLIRTLGIPRDAFNMPYMRRDDLYGGTINIGLCWQGNPEHGNDRWRSIGVDQFSDALAGVAGYADFYSLQKTDVARPEFAKVSNCDSLKLLARTIEEMDLVVTVDTSILHIAGAMGIPTLALVPSNPDWRWGMTGSKTDWYPSVELFRATEPLGWKPVLDRVRDRVQKFIEERTKA